MTTRKQPTTLITKASTIRHNRNLSHRGLVLSLPHQPHRLIPYSLRLVPGERHLQEHHQEGHYLDEHHILEHIIVLKNIILKAKTPKLPSLFK